jgi:amidase
MDNTIDDLQWLDATATAEAVRDGVLSPAEAVGAAIERVERLNPKLNAVAWRSFERALGQASDPALPDGPFRGVPLLLKDALAHVAGDRVTHGSQWLLRNDWRPSATSALGQRFLDAGVCILGRTTCPELILGDTTEPRAYGVTRNPWDPSRTPAGSSGGSAAAVASGMVPVAHGNDTGGSLRMPASLCGLVAHKPSRAATSPAPLTGLITLLLGEGVLARSVRDVAGFFDWLGGWTPGDQLGGPFAAPGALGAVVAGAQGSGPRLRIGVLTERPDGGSVDPEVTAAVESMARRLEAAGHHLVPVQPAHLALHAFDDVQIQLFPALVAAEVRGWATVLGEEPGPDDLEPYIRQLADFGALSTAADLAAAVEAMGAASRSTVGVWGDIDVLLTPTTPMPAPPVDHFHRDDSFATFLAGTELGAFCGWVNMTGQPATSVPIGLTAVTSSRPALPIGGQLVGAPGADATVLGLAAEWEALTAPFPTP